MSGVLKQAVLLEAHNSRSFHYTPQIGIPLKLPMHPKGGNGGGGGAVGWEQYLQLSRYMWFFRTIFFEISFNVVSPWEATAIYCTAVLPPTCQFCSSFVPPYLLRYYNGSNYYHKLNRPAYPAGKTELHTQRTNPFSLRYVFLIQICGERELNPKIQQLQAIR
jgi:hypothetical protein